MKKLEGVTRGEGNKPASTLVYITEKQHEALTAMCGKGKVSAQIREIIDWYLVKRKKDVKALSGNDESTQLPPPVNITLLEGEYKELKALADATKLPVTEHIRRAVDEYFAGRR